MTSRTETPDIPPRYRLRSVGAVLLGFASVVILSLGTDQVLHVLEVYPPWGRPMRDPGLNLLALSYRAFYGALGSYVAAKFAPYAPMRHAVMLGVLGVIMGVVGAVGSIPLDLGPAWYPVALVIVTLPGAWLGGAVYRRRHPEG